MSRIRLHLLRSLVRRPGFSLAATLLVTLAAGAAHGVLVIADQTFLRPLPYQRPGELVAIQTVDRVPGDSSTPLPLAAMQLVRWRAESKRLAGLAGYTPGVFAITGQGEPQPVAGATVSAGLFDLLGIHPEFGRDFGPADEQAGSGTALISHALWQRRLGGRGDVVGSTVVVDGAPRVVVGVLPPEATLVFQPGDVWLPMTLGPEAVATTRIRTIAGLGRLAPGADVGEARAELGGLGQALARELPDAFRANQVSVTPLRESLFGPQRTVVLVIGLAVALLLAIAAANIANLALADMVHTRVATITRLAMGSGRRRVLLNRLAEAATLGLTGGVAGLLLGRAVLAALVATLPDAFIGSVASTAGLATMTVLVAVVIAVVAVLPAAAAEWRLDLAAAAGAGLRVVGGAHRSREWLLGAQAAVTMALLAGAVMLGRRVYTLLNHSPGFQATGVVVAPLSMSLGTYPTADARGAHVERLLEVVRGLREVRSASTIQTRFVLNETMQTVVAVDGRPVDPARPEFVNIRNVMPDLFTTLGITVREGRPIDPTDRADSRPVAVVSAALARKYWGGASPLGKQIRRANRADAPWLEIVGVVDDVEDQGVGVVPGPTLYVPYLQQNTPTARVTLVAKVVGDPARIGARLRQALWSVDRDQVVEDVTPLPELLRRSAATPRFQALVVALFGGAALALVLGGAFALTLFGVRQQTRELGVRAALGARPAGLVRLAMWRGLRPMATGLAVGAVLIVLGAVAATPRGWVLGPTDLALLGLMVPVMLVASVGATLLPARRATRISPVEAMRQ